MTFDEAIEVLKQDRVAKDSVAESFMFDVIEQLRDTYEPTVTMTQQQYDTFVQNTDFGRAQTKMDLGFGEMTILQYGYISMNPETIKVVDE